MLFEQYFGEQLEANQKILTQVLPEELLNDSTRDVSVLARIDTNTNQNQTHLLQMGQTLAGRSERSRADKDPAEGEESLAENTSVMDEIYTESFRDLEKAVSAARFKVTFLATNLRTLINQLVKLVRPAQKEVMEGCVGAHDQISADFATYKQNEKSLRYAASFFKTQVLTNLQKATMRAAARKRAVTAVNGTLLTDLPTPEEVSAEVDKLLADSPAVSTTAVSTGLAQLSVLQLEGTATLGESTETDESVLAAVGSLLTPSMTAPLELPSASSRLPSPTSFGLSLADARPEKLGTRGSSSYNTAAGGELAGYQSGLGSRLFAEPGGGIRQLQSSQARRRQTRRDRREAVRKGHRAVVSAFADGISRRTATAFSESTSTQLLQQSAYSVASSHAAKDPFAKVKNLISSLITKLKKEAKEADSASERCEFWLNHAKDRADEAAEQLTFWTARDLITRYAAEQAAEELGLTMRFASRCKFVAHSGRRGCRPRLSVY